MNSGRTQGSASRYFTCERIVPKWATTLPYGKALAGNQGSNVNDKHNENRGYNYGPLLAGNRGRRSSQCAVLLLPAPPLLAWLRIPILQSRSPLHLFGLLSPGLDCAGRRL